MHSFKKGRAPSGFTIVELLIVIVVIGILAAVTLVSYNGIQNRAKQSAAQSATSQASKKLQTYFLTNADTYPPDLATAGITNSGDTTFQYSYNNSVNPKTYCITATTNTISYYQNNTTQPSPAPGGCPGHGVGGVAAVTNLVLNPSVESNLTDWRGYGSTSISAFRSSVRAYSGTYSLRVASGGSVSSYGVQAKTGTLTPNTAYTANAWIYRETGSSPLKFRFEWWTASNTHIAATEFDMPVTTGQWLRGTLTATAPSTADYVYVSVYYPTVLVGDIAFVDAAMLVQASSAPTYADGSSPNWVWNGSPNNSTSTGPPL